MIPRSLALLISLVACVHVQSHRTSGFVRNVGSAATRPHPPTRSTLGGAEEYSSAKLASACSAPPTRPLASRSAVLWSTPRQ